VTGERYDEVDLERSAILEEELRRTTRSVVRARKIVTVASVVVWFLVGLALVSLVALLVAAPRRASETPPSPALPEPSRADGSALRRPGTSRAGESVYLGLRDVPVRPAPLAGLHQGLPGEQLRRGARL